MKNYIILPLRVFILFFEIIILKFFKIQNTKLSYQTFIKLFCLSGGWSNDLINLFLSKKSKKIAFCDKNEIFKKKFNEDGFFLVKNFLSKNDLEKTRSYLNKCQGKWFGDNYISKENEILDINNVKAAQYKYCIEDLLNFDLFQKLITDPEIIKYSNLSLNAQPILTGVHCWKSFPNIKPDSFSAQLWHFDMDSPKWVKLFFYLEDCNEDNGPHCFIKGSHKNNGISYQLRKKGYSRLTDIEVESNYKKNEIIEFKCRGGDLLIENTRGLHKGKQLKSGSRFIFQLEFASSLFGGINIKKYNVKKSSVTFANILKEQNYTYQILR